jgi:hypothetical protein
MLEVVVDMASRVVMVKATLINSIIPLFVTRNVYKITQEQIISETVMGKYFLKRKMAFNFLECS